MLPKVKTVPDLAENSPVHQAALAAGKSHFGSWYCNVTDELKSKTTEEIRQHLKDTAYPYAVCCENIIGDFNFGTLIRNSNAFNAQEVFYIGNKKFDRRSTVGTHLYKDVQWLSTVDEFIKLKSKYTFVGIDNVSGSVSLAAYKYPKNPLFIFGEEGCGLSPTIKSLCQDIVHIDQFGSVRSLNVGVASGILMFDFVSKYNSSVT